MNRATTLQNYKKRIKKALVYIEAHLDEDIPLKTLAQVTRFSLYHFHRVFSGLTGESVKSYVRRLKLERAARELLSSNLSITTLAFSAGYASLEAFTRAFQEMFTVSPKTYRAEKREQRLNDILQFKIGVIKMKVTVENVPKMKVVCVRHVGPYMECEAAFKKLFSSPSVKYTPDRKVLGVCYDDPVVTDAQKTRYDACVTVDNDFVIKEEGFMVKEVGGGKYAVTRHIGPYTELYKTYTTLVGQWVPQHGHELRSEPPIEVYLNDPEITPATELITDIYIPIK
jgi:AraC family transcriptional regulator